MGISYQDARQLLRAKTAGASFDTVATIGRQSLYLREDEALSLCEEFGLPTAAPWVLQARGTAADGFFAQALGTASLVAIDASDYEGAAVVLDMNQRVPETLSQSVDAVIDGGSLEHIFNVPVALANLMRLVRIGGRVFIGAPSNNLCGHGFYQFSPEMMFRVFTRDRGFVLHDVAMFEYTTPDITLRPARRAWRVVDPEVVGQRVGLMSRRAAILWVHAEKVSHLDDPLATAPQQSDYVGLWTGGVAESETGRTARAAIRDMVPHPLLRAWRWYEQRRRFSTRNRRFYSRLP